MRSTSTTGNPSSVAPYIAELDVQRVEPPQPQHVDGARADPPGHARDQLVAERDRLLPDALHVDEVRQPRRRERAVRPTCPRRAPSASCGQARSSAVESRRRRRASGARSPPARATPRRRPGPRVRARGLPRGQRLAHHLARRIGPQPPVRGHAAAGGDGRQRDPGGDDRRARHRTRPIQTAAPPSGRPVSSLRPHICRAADIHESSLAAQYAAGPPATASPRRHLRRFRMLSRSRSGFAASPVAGHLGVRGQQRHPTTPAGTGGNQSGNGRQRRTSGRGGHDGHGGDIRARPGPRGGARSTGGGGSATGSAAAARTTRQRRHGAAPTGGTGGAGGSTRRAPRDAGDSGRDRRARRHDGNRGRAAPRAATGGATAGTTGTAGTSGSAGTTGAGGGPTLIWPNDMSKANSDDWLVQNHDKISQLQPTRAGDRPREHRRTRRR